MIAVIGEALGKSGGEPLNSSSPSGRNLSALVGKSVELWADTRVNLCVAEWNLPEAIATSQSISEKLMADGREWTVILLGRRALKAHELEDLAWFRVIKYQTLRFVPFPHPSGLSRWWNNKTNKAYAAGFLKGILTEEGRI